MRAKMVLRNNDFKTMSFKIMLSRIHLKSIARENKGLV